jgi:hypothetical protein
MLDEAIVDLSFFDHFLSEKFYDTTFFDKLDNVSCPFGVVWHVFEKFVDAKKVVLIIGEKSCYYTVYHITQLLHHISEGGPCKVGIKVKLSQTGHARLLFHLIVEIRLKSLDSRNPTGAIVWLVDKPFLLEEIEVFSEGRGCVLHIFEAIEIF